MRGYAFLILAIISMGCSNHHLDGADGVAGQDGHDTLVMMTNLAGVPASTCASGSGVLFQSGLDMDRDGVLENSEVISNSYICNGQAGADGAQGPQGQTGATGQAGANGTNGQDATPVTAVQFCPNSGATGYPNSFPEFGLCLSGNIYAVYWDGHNSWLAQVVPGYYASTSTSAPCNFTVAPNCQVSQ